MTLAEDKVTEIFCGLLRHRIEIDSDGSYCNSNIFNDISISNGFVKIRVSI
jgi:hypothetical protein